MTWCQGPQTHQETQIGVLGVNRKVAKWRIKGAEVARLGPGAEALVTDIRITKKAQMTVEGLPGVNREVKESATEISE